MVLFERDLCLSNNLLIKARYELQQLCVISSTLILNSNPQIFTIHYATQINKLMNQQKKTQN